jgi:tetratricopeptide (TPR) repeat protein
MAWSSELARVLRVVVVSPGDVMVERERLGDIVDELNRRLAPAHGYQLSLWRWETDAHPGLHLEGPQGLIDVAMRIEDADVVVGIFWKRFGTPTAGAGSGTAHELQRAWSVWRETGRPQVMVYFCQRPYMPQSSAETVQQKQVLSFRETMPEHQLWWTYTTTEDFERAVREHLTAFILAQNAETPTAPATTEVRLGWRVRFRLPLGAAYFTGRDVELDAIDAALGVADRAVVTQAITGLGGVGKSQLAARYVHKRAGEYDVVAWIRAEDGGIGDLSELAAELDLPITQLTPAERANRVLRWLGRCDDRWLLVLDNVAAPEQLLGCCPAAGNGRVIITTRHRGMAQFGPALPVDVFDESTAVEYLLNVSGRAEDHDGATRVARTLGFLPLALSHAGAYCAAGTSFAEYLQLLGMLPAAELFDSHPETSYAQTVASTWQVSIQAAERQAPLARQVLAVAAYLAPDAIPRALFEVLLTNASTAPERKPLSDALNALHRLSLAEVDDDSISVHRLLQRTVREDPAVRADETVARSALAAVAAGFPSDHAQPRTWPQSEQLLPHACAIDASFTSPGDEGQRLVTLLNSVSEYLLRADRGARAVDAATRASARAQQILGPEHPDALRARGKLAVSYLGAGRIEEAIDVGEQVLADCERILDPDHPDRITTRASLAQFYWDAGRIDEAIELGKRVLADCERILGPEHPHTLTTATVLLAVSYDSAQYPGEAVESAERLLADCVRVLGAEHPDTLRAGWVLVLSYRRAGRTREAIELGESVLANSERILGCEHPDTLRIGSILAFSYRMAGRVGEAIKLGERVLADCERILGPHHPETLRTRMIIAFSYRTAGRVGEAIELGKRVLADSERILGHEHLYTLRAGMILTRSFRTARRIGEAIELGERVLADCERILGREHPDTLRARGNLADSYRAAGQDEGIEEDVRRQVGPSGGEDT